MQILSNCKGKVSSIWQVIKEMIPSQKNKFNTFAIDKLKDRAEEFNHCFSRVGKATYNCSQKLNGTYTNSPIDLNDSNTDPSLFFRPDPVNTNGYFNH